MEWNIPGTTLHIPREQVDEVESLFHAMFLGGGVVLRQVAAVTGLEAHMIQNWVKRGFLPHPEKKLYSLRQFCRILNINMLRPALPLDKICELLSYVNGRLDDTSDDIIDDAVLYFLFVKLAARVRQLDEPGQWNRAMEEALADYIEPVPGARERVEKALRVMMTARIAAIMKEEADHRLQELLKGET